MAEIDIDHFFDSISISKLEKAIDYFLDIDEILRELLRRYLRCRVEIEGRIKTKQRGVIQGSPISPLLSNLYLTILDSHMLKEKYAAVRFSDDIRIFSETDTGAAEALEKVEQMLSVMDLQISKGKSGVFRAVNRKFLGYYFEKNGDGSVLAKRKRKDEIQYQNWHASALQRLDKNYHLINNGILTKKDFSLLFENENGKKYLPVEATDSVNVYSDVIFSSRLFEFLSTKKMKVALFDKYGRSIGSFYSDRYPSASKTMLKQAAVYLNETKRLQLAKRLDMVAMHNIRSNVRYYKKQKKSEILEETIQMLSNVIANMNEVTTLDELMLLEARGRQAYYRAFNEIITDENFKFVQRTKRPPKDALNAMISFGNVYLYNRISTEIHKTSLDIRIGILHSANSRAESLNLDVAELFKPILVDRAIFTLINKRMVHSKEHFEKTDRGGVYLNKAGKRLFLEEMEKKLYQTVQFGDNQRTYEYIMREEIQKILRYMLYDAAYKPYKYTT